MSEIRLNDFLAQRWLTDLLRAGIYLRHQQGNDAAAVELMRDLLGMIRALHAAPGDADEQLLTVGMSSKLMAIVFELTPELAIGGSAQNAQSGQLRQLIADLLDRGVAHLGFEAWGLLFRLFDLLCHAKWPANGAPTTCWPRQAASLMASSCPRSARRAT